MAWLAGNLIRSPCEMNKLSYDFKDNQRFLVNAAE